MTSDEREKAECILAHHADGLYVERGLRVHRTVDTERIRQLLNDAHDEIDALRSVILEMFSVQHDDSELDCIGHSLDMSDRTRATILRVLQSEYGEPHRPPYSHPC